MHSARGALSKYANSDRVKDESSTWEKEVVKNMEMLDTNMILRYLLNDNKEMADEAEKIIKEGSAQVSIEVIAEVV